MIALGTETTLSLAEAATRVRRNIGTVRMWITRGVGGVRLRALRTGRLYVTSIEALQEFAEATDRARRKAPKMTARDVAMDVDERVQRANAEYEATIKRMAKNRAR